MAPSQDPAADQVEVPEQVQQAAQAAHGFITQVEHFIQAAKDELARFIPVSILDRIEQTAEQAARDAISGQKK